MTTEPEDATAENFNAYETASISTTIFDYTTKIAAFLDPTNQLAVAFEFYIQYAVIGIGLFGVAANSTILYALVAYHKRDTKKKAVNLLLINQNLIDLVSCVLLVITFSLRLSHMYLTGALGYFICYIFINEHISSIMAYASIINLIPKVTEIFYLCSPSI